MPEVIFNGPAGRIEARYHQSKVPASPIAILLHPHRQIPQRVVDHPAHAGVDRRIVTLTRTGDADPVQVGARRGLRRARRESDRRAGQDGGRSQRPYPSYSSHVHPNP